MTGLEKIIEQIEKDSQESASLIISEAQKKADSMICDAKAVVNEKKALHIKEIEVLKATILDRAKSSAELESRKIILSKKISLIEKAISEAMDKLSTLPCDNYFELLSKLAEKYKGDTKAQLQLSQKDLARMPENFGTKLPSNISVSDKCANIENGFLLIFDGIDINCSFEALFSDKTEDLQDVVASILFK